MEAEALEKANTHEPQSDDQLVSQYHQQLAQYHPKNRLAADTGLPRVTADGGIPHVAAEGGIPAVLSGFTAANPHSESAATAATNSAAAQQRVREQLEDLSSDDPASPAPPVQATNIGMYVLSMSSVKGS